MVAPPAGQQASLFSGAVELLLTDSFVRGRHTARPGPEHSHPFLYPPQAMAAQRHSEKTDPPCRS